MEGLTPKFQSLYPFRSRCINLDGNLYHFVDEGEGENLLLLHGNPSWSFYYRKLILALRGSHRLIAVDHIGCGLSDKPQKYPYTLAQHISNVERLVEQRGLRDITLVVHDWGGPIGLGFAVRNPETISRIIILNTVGFPLPKIPWFLRVCGSKRLGAFLVRRLNLFAKTAARVGVRTGNRMSKEVREAYLAPYDSYAHRVAIHRFIQDIPFRKSSSCLPLLQDIEAGLQKLKDIPTLIVWGGKDPVFTLSALQRWREHLPDADVVLLPQSGHYVLEDSPDKVLKEIDAFLTRTHRYDSNRRSAP
jgi:haloalkane dehalogenase